MEKCTGWQTRVMSLSPAPPPSLSGLGEPWTSQPSLQFVCVVELGGWAEVCSCPSLQPFLTSMIFWGCEPDWTQGSVLRNWEQRVVAVRCETYLSCSFLSLSTTGRKWGLTPLSEMGPWRDSWPGGQHLEDRVEKGVYAHGEGGLKSHTHSQPCPVTVETMGPASEKTSQLEGAGAEWGTQNRRCVGAHWL